MKYTVLSSRQVGQLIRRGTLPLKHGVKGYWRCPKTHRRIAGETETWWSKGDSVCPHGPAQIVYPDFRIVVDLSL
jgi:hypothetical protein